MMNSQRLDPQNVAEELQRHILDSAQVQEFLTQLAIHASDSLSRQGPRIHCGVTLLRDRRGDMAASSGPEAALMDELQYKYDEGPCLSAARNGEVFHAPHLSREKRWPEYIAEIRGTGVESIMAAPFDLLGEALGALNLYAEGAAAFDEDMQDLALAYAAQASASIRLAVRIAQLLDTTKDLKAALASRTVIDVAVGIIMGQNRCNQEEAFSILQRASSTRNMKLRDVAMRIVENVAPGDVGTHFDG
ncbi:ANTAR domain-containing protein [Arthrobacter sp.]|uniref:ANTAR domain-containing protein n=1 Tax=Arthrobacter sp. TaxID=1667 RepID=UPI003A8F6AF2